MLAPDRSRIGPLPLGAFAAAAVLGGPPFAIKTCLPLLFVPAMIGSPTDGTAGYLRLFGWMICIAALGLYSLP